MIQFFKQGGPFMWPLLIFTIVIIALAVKKMIHFLGGQDLSPDRLESGINAILFWGFMSMILGFLAHFQGVYLAMQNIMEANDVSPAIVSEGYMQSLTTILFGLFIFMISTAIWFTLRWRLKRTSVIVK